MEVAKRLSEVDCTVEHISGSSVFLAYLLSFVVSAKILEFILNASIVCYAYRRDAIAGSSDDHCLGNEFGFKVSALSWDSSFCRGSLVLNASHRETSWSVVFTFKG